MAKNDPGSLDGLRTEAYRRQDNLAADIDELIDRVHPRNVAIRLKNEATRAVKGFFVADDGSYDLPHIGMVAGGVVGVLSLVTGTGILAARRGRKRRSRR